MAWMSYLDCCNTIEPLYIHVTTLCHTPRVPRHAFVPLHNFNYRASVLYEHDMSTGVVYTLKNPSLVIQTTHSLFDFGAGSTRRLNKLGLTTMPRMLKLPLSHMQFIALQTNAYIPSYTTSNIGEHVFQKSACTGSEKPVWYRYLDRPYRCCN